MPIDRTPTLLEPLMNTSTTTLKAKIPTCTNVFIFLLYIFGDRYTQNGLLMLLDRNRRIKSHPQRFQDSTSAYDIIITCEERCFDIVCDTLAHKKIAMNKPVYVINFDIKDTPDDATIGARAMLILAQQLQECQDLEGEAEGIIESFAIKSAHPTLYTVHFY